MIASDLDGTLIDHGGRLDGSVVQAFADARRRGFKVVLATGRSYPQAVPYWRQLALDTPLVAAQGADVRQPATGEVLWQHLIPEATVTLAAGVLRAAGLMVGRYSREQFWHEGVADPLMETYLARVKAPARIVPRIENLGGEASKVVALGPPPLVAEVLAEVARLLEGHAEVLRSLPFHVDIVPPGITKATALERLAPLLGIAGWHEVMVFGDADNDLTMIRKAAVGVAVGDATPAVLAAARHHVPQVGLGPAGEIDRLLRADGIWSLSSS